MACYSLCLGAAVSLFRKSGVTRHLQIGKKLAAALFAIDQPADRFFI